MDKIIVKGLRVFAYHGVNSEEKEFGQPFELDIAITADLSKACKTDRIEDTVNYSKVVKLASEVMQSGKYNLIEHVASLVADAILDNFPVESVTVLLKKPEAPIKSAVFDYVGVEITRTRSGKS